MNAPPINEAPVRVRDVLFAARYGISKRLGGEWLRRAEAAGVVARVGARLFYARLSALDEWVLAGAKAPTARTRRSPRGAS